MLRHQSFLGRLVFAGICLACLAPFAAVVGKNVEQAPDSERAPFNSRDFDPPDGFDGYDWNTPLGEIDRLEAEPVYVKVAYSSGKVVHFGGNCFKDHMDRDDDGIIDTGAPLGIGSHSAMAIYSCRHSVGAGSYALAEYFVDGQGFRVSDERGEVVLFPITYQFCAQWRGVPIQLKGDPMETMRLCGARLNFQSETEAQAEAIADPMYRTAYDRTLSWLIKDYGLPQGYERKGTVIVPGSATERKKRSFAKGRHQTEYWCRPTGNELVPNCAASIVLSFDPKTGRGEVIFLTPVVWKYAYARQFGGAEGDPLYRVLHGGFRQPKVIYQCTESFLCKPSKPKGISKEMLDRFRLKAANRE